MVFDKQDTGINLLKPDSLFSLTLDRYENAYEGFQIEIISFGILFAICTIWMRYTFFNKDNAWIKLIKKLNELYVCKKVLF